MSNEKEKNENALVRSENRGLTKRSSGLVRRGLTDLAKPIVTKKLLEKICDDLEDFNFDVKAKAAIRVSKLGLSFDIKQESADKVLFTLVRVFDNCIGENSRQLGLFDCGEKYYPPNEDFRRVLISAIESIVGSISDTSDAIIWALINGNRQTKIKAAEWLGENLCYKAIPILEESYKAYYDNSESERSKSESEMDKAERLVELKLSQVSLSINGSEIIVDNLETYAAFYQLNRFYVGKYGGYREHFYQLTASSQHVKHFLQVMKERLDTMEDKGYSKDAIAGLKKVFNAITQASAHSIKETGESAIIVIVRKSAITIIVEDARVLLLAFEYALRLLDRMQIQVFGSFEKGADSHLDQYFDSLVRNFHDHLSSLLPEVDLDKYFDSLVRNAYWSDDDGEEYIEKCRDYIVRLCAKVSPDSVGKALFILARVEENNADCEEELLEQVMLLEPTYFSDEILLDLIGTISVYFEEKRVRLYLDEMITEAIERGIAKDEIRKRPQLLWRK